MTYPSRAIWQTSSIELLFQFGNKSGVFLALQPLLQSGHQLRAVVRQESRGIEPETWKNLASQNAVRAGRERLILVFLQGEPVDFVILGSPKQILPSARPAIHDT